MLRAKPSKIGLEARDLEWHITRHEDRQAQRANAATATATEEVTDTPESGEETDGTGLVFKHSVPRSQAFWRKFSSEISAPLKTQSTSAQSAKLIQPSDDWLESNRSIRACYEDSDAGMPANPVTYEQYGQDLDLLGSEMEDIEQCSTHSSHSSHSTTGVDEAHAATEPKGELTEVAGPPTTRCRIMSFFHRKAKQDDSFEVQKPKQRHDGRHGVYDGTVDPHEQLQIYNSPSSEGSSGSDIADGLYGSRRDRRTISSNLEVYSNEWSERGEDLPTPTIIKLPHRPGPTALDVPNQADLPERPSSTITTQSSTPDKEIISPTSSHALRPPETPRLLAQPAKRRNMTYRHRSETYSFDVSEGSSRSTTSQDNVQMVDQTESESRFSPETNFRSLLLTASPSSTTEPATTNNLVSPNRLRNSWAPASPTTPSANSTSPNLTSHEVADSQTPSPRQPTAYASERRSVSSSSRFSPYRLPTRPFSATRRSPPLSLSFLRNTFPLPPRTPTSRRRLHHPRSLSPITPRTPRARQFSLPEDLPDDPILPLSVYNDHLPPATQPQTPADLGRRGRHRLPQNPFNTVPARPLWPLERLRGVLGTPTLPTAADRRRWAANAVAENAGSVTPEERVWRRNRATGFDGSG